MQEIASQGYEAFRRAHLDTLLDAATKLQEKNNAPVRILDLATGPNEFNPGFFRELHEHGIDFRAVLTDISPTHLHRGCENLERSLSPEQLGNVIYVLADGNDLRTETSAIRLYSDKGLEHVPLRQVLADPKYRFLHTGYRQGKRIEAFADASFDMITGIIPYGSMGHYDQAIRESARVLRHGSYEIILEWEVAQMNQDAPRTEGALRGARQPHLRNIRECLDRVLEFVKVMSIEREYRADYTDPDEVVQNGDILRHAVLVYRKAK